MVSPAKPACPSSEATTACASLKPVKGRSGRSGAALEANTAQPAAVGSGSDATSADASGAGASAVSGGAATSSPTVASASSLTNPVPTSLPSCMLRLPTLFVPYPGEARVCGSMAVLGAGRCGEAADGTLVGLRHAQAHTVRAAAADDHQADRQPVGQAGRHGGRRVPADVERRGVADHLQGPGDLLFAAGVG